MLGGGGGGLKLDQMGMCHWGLKFTTCMIEIFRGRRGGWGGGSSERCLKWGGGGVGESSRDLSKNILKQGVGKSCSYRGGGFEGVTTPAPHPVLE